VQKTCTVTHPKAKETCSCSQYVISFNSSTACVQITYASMLSGRVGAGVYQRRQAETGRDPLPLQRLDLLCNQRQPECMQANSPSHADNVVGKVENKRNPSANSTCSTYIRSSLEDGP
jgi:hypothetical protein